MKKLKKLIVAAVLCVTVVAVAAPSVYAQTDVTKKVSSTEKTNLKKTAREFLEMSAINLNYDLKSGSSKTYNFSKGSARKEFTKHIFRVHSSLDNAGRKTLAKQLFGKKTTLGKQHVGDWGDIYPVATISKIYKTSAKKYSVCCKVYMKVSGGEKTYLGTETFKLTKNSKAKYGYYVNKLTVKKA